MRFEIKYPQVAPSLQPTLADMKNGQWGIIRDPDCLYSGWLVRCTRENDDQQKGWHCFGPNGEHKVFGFCYHFKVEILPPGAAITIIP